MNVRTAIKLGEAVGRLQEKLDSIGLPYRMIPVAKWKSLALGNGSADKKMVKKLIMATAGVGDGHPQDIYDACGIAIAGYGLEREFELSGAHQSGNPSQGPP